MLNVTLNKNDRLDYTHAVDIIVIETEWEIATEAGE